MSSSESEELRRCGSNGNAGGKDRCHDGYSEGRQRRLKWEWESFFHVFELDRRKPSTRGMMLDDEMAWWDWANQSNTQMGIVLFFFSSCGKHVIVFHFFSFPLFPPLQKTFKNPNFLSMFPPSLPIDNRCHDSSISLWNESATIAH